MAYHDPMSMTVGGDVSAVKGQYGRRFGLHRWRMETDDWRLKMSAMAESQEISDVVIDILDRWAEHSEHTKWLLDLHAGRLDSMLVSQPQGSARARRTKRRR